MKLRFLRQWLAYKPGQVTDNIGGGQGVLLIRRGYAEEVTDAPVRTDAHPPRPGSKDMRKRAVANK